MESNAQGQKTPGGSYRVVIKAQHSSGPVVVKTQFKGIVEAVEFLEKGPRLRVEGRSVDLKDVKEIGLNKSPQSPVLQAAAPQSKLPGNKIFRRERSTDQCGQQTSNSWFPDSRGDKKMSQVRGNKNKK